MEIVVIEKIGNDYLVEFILDGESFGTRMMDYKEMMVTIETKEECNVKITFLEEVKEYTVTVEEYGDEIDVVLNTWTHSEDGINYKDTFLKTYKRMSSAIKFAESFGYKVEII